MDSSSNARPWLTARRAAVVALVAMLLLIGWAVVDRSWKRDHVNDTTELAAERLTITQIASKDAAAETRESAQSAAQAEPRTSATLQAASTLASPVNQAEHERREAAAPTRRESLSVLGEALLVETSDSITPPLPAIGPAAIGGEAPSVLDMLNEPADHPQLPADWASTSLFGVEAKGRKFVYVFDRSGSMGQPANRALAAAKAELIHSLERLESVHQFHLIFYNTDARVFNPTGVQGRLVFGTDENKEAARRFIESIPADGGTNHYDPLLVAVRLRPDVIFLLTDGEQKDDLAADELARIRRLNDGIAQIYVIQFASTPYASNSLKQLAAENRGEHTYFDIRKVVGP